MYLYVTEVLMYACVTQVLKYVCMHSRKHVYTCICVHMHMYTHAYVYVCICMYGTADMEHDQSPILTCMYVCI